MIKSVAQKSDDSRHAQAMPGIDRYWVIFCLLVVAAVFAGGITWVFAHPFGTSYDETSYFTKLHQDVAAIHSGSPSAIVRRAIKGDVNIPPLNRWLTMPIVAVTGVQPWTARLISAGFFVIALLLTYRLAKALGGGAAGVLAVALVCLAPHLIAPIFRYGTEFGLMLGLATSLFFLVRIWLGPERTWLDWLGLAIGLALGSLAKLTFAPIILPVLGATAIRLVMLPDRKKLIIRLMLTGVLAAIFLLPWYAFNLKSAIEYGSYAQSFTKHQIDSRTQYPDLLVSVVLGIPLALIIAAVFISGMARLKSVARNVGSRDQLWLVAVLIATPLPLIFMHLMGQNHNPRFLGAPMFPMLIGIAILAAWSGWTRNAVATTILSVMMVAQLVIHITPGIDRRDLESPYWVDHNKLAAFITYPQWNWHELYNHPNLDIPDQPKIALLGSGHSFNRVQVAAPWAERGVWIRPAHLWNYDHAGEEENFDLNLLMQNIKRFDLILTVPGYEGDYLDRQVYENMHNAEFAESLAASPDFDGPITLTFDDNGPVEVLVFQQRRPSSE